MSSVAVSTRDLGKTYRLYSNPWARLLEALVRKPCHRDFVALSGVSFELPRGEGFGVIGQNGAGKSTLLKILAGIVAPSAGTLDVSGKTAAILELGSGFHPEFTGRQNIRLNAAMLGLTARELDAKLPEIIEFSELGEFIDQPVKTYSTGMAMRLGFAIATQVEPDVLIIDEALSVGDGYFQKKCMDYMQQFLADGGTLLFCSHAMYYVSAFCQQVLWLRNGKMEALGATNDVVRDYQSFLMAKSQSYEEAGRDERISVGDDERGQPARITVVKLHGGEAPAAGGPRRFRQGDPLAVEVEWLAEDPELEFHLGIGINRIDEVEVLVFSTHQEGRSTITGSHSYHVSLEVPELPIKKGRFTLYVFLLDREGLHIFDRWIQREAFDMITPSFVLGMLDTEHVWRLESPPTLQIPAVGGQRRVSEQR